MAEHSSESHREFLISNYFWHALSILQGNSAPGVHILDQSKSCSIPSADHFHFIAIECGFGVRTYAFRTRSQRWHFVSVWGEHCLNAHILWHWIFQWTPFYSSWNRFPSLQGKGERRVYSLWERTSTSAQNGSACLGAFVRQISRILCGHWFLINNALSIRRYATHSSRDQLVSSSPVNHRNSIFLQRKVSFWPCLGQQYFLALKIKDLRNDSDSLDS